ncbi:MAG: hypothetical protein JO107_10240 [Hyphomicrobiales bacterium]|nr:hypothetical protein [Hyphomicrobiales bacterium]MBV8663469.1 hypothetical protein [Hyphomicrobiales bacterium]
MADYLVVPSPNYPAPNYAAFGQTLGNLANVYREGQAQQQQLDQSKAFQNGLPTDANGNPDYAAIMRVLAQKGDINAIPALAGPAQTQLQMNQAQQVSPLLSGGGNPMANAPPASVGAAMPTTSAATATSQPVPQPASNSGPYGDLSAATQAFPSLDKIVSGAVSDPSKAGPVTATLAAAMNVDPNAPLTSDQAQQAQRILGSYAQRTGTRGEQNNNPDNIENGSFAQSQPGYAGAEQNGRFATFDNPEDGLNAAANLLGVYGRQGINTIAQITAKWAPGSEKGNDPTAYADTVSKSLGVDKNQPLDLTNSDARRAIAAAMAKVESRMTFPASAAGSSTVGSAPPAGQSGARPIVPQVPLPQGFTDPQQAILAIDREMARLSTNPYARGQVQALQDWRDRIAESTKPMQVGPSTTIIDPRTGQPLYQGPYAGANGTLSPAALDAAAETYFQSGKMPPNLGRGMQGSANMNAIINRATELHPDDDPSGWAKRWQNFGAGAAGERQLAQRAANLELAENEAKTLIPRVKDASQNVSRTQYPTLNSIIQAMEKGTGDPNVVRLGIAANSLIYVYSRVLKPTGVINESDTRAAHDILDKAWSEGQIDAALDQMETEIASAKQGLAVTQDEMAGRKPSQSGSGTAPTPNGAPTASGAPAGPAGPGKPDQDGWVTLPGGVRIRQKDGQGGGQSAPPPADGGFGGVLPWLGGP